MLRTGVLLSAILAGSFANGIPAMAQADWASNPIWDDGQAEVNKYDSERNVYGKVRNFETIMVVVKEDFNAAFTTKADWPYDGKTTYPVLKMNLVQVIPTENYDYHYLTSVFIDKANPLDLVKLAVSSQEWCGTTYKEWKPRQPEGNYHYHSYWDGEGDGSVRIDKPDNAFSEDQLLVSLRAMAGKKLPEKVQILPSVIHSRKGATDLVAATLADVGETKVSAAGKTYNCREIVLEMPDGENHYFIDTESPNLLVKFERYDGQKLTLKDTSRWKYWEH